eukprot:scaffold69_cov248-Pinguiococcus_pyrenoidosus.AAC.39
MNALTRRSSVLAKSALRRFSSNGMDFMKGATCDFPAETPYFWCASPENPEADLSRTAAF